MHSAQFGSDPKSAIPCTVNACYRTKVFLVVLKTWVKVVVTDECQGHICTTTRRSVEQAESGKMSRQCRAEELMKHVISGRTQSAMFHVWAETVIRLILKCVAAVRKFEEHGRKKTDGLAPGGAMLIVTRPGHRYLAYSVEYCNGRHRGDAPLLQQSQQRVSYS